MPRTAQKLLLFRANTAVTITLTASLPAGYLQVAYSQTVSASGGTAPYTYAVTSGSLPAGLSLNASTGAITGTPTAVATSTPTITATDAGGHTGSKAYSIAITADWSQLATFVAPVGWWKQDATAGTNQPNAGSGGSALDMAITSATLGQSSPLGANTAFLLDGAASRLQTPNNAALAALTTWEYVFLINPSSAGEGNFGNFFIWNEGSTEPYASLNTSLTSIRGSVTNTTPTSFQTITTSGLTVSTWALLFIAFDNAGDRKIHIYKGVAGAVSEYAYSVQPALTGTYKTPSTVFNLFNDTGQANTFAGLGGAVQAYNGNLTAAQRTAFTLAAGV